MEWSIPVRLAGQEVAQLRCAGDGLRTVFLLDCPEQPGLYKLWLEGSGTYLLGTPAPVGGRLTFKKLVSNRELEGIRPITAASLVPVGEEPRPREGISAAEISDPELREQLARGGFTPRREGERLIFSRPWQPGQEFPAPALFALTRWENGRLSIVLRRGWPAAGPLP